VELLKRKFLVRRNRKVQSVKVESESPFLLFCILCSVYPFLYIPYRRNGCRFFGAADRRSFAQEEILLSWLEGSQEAVVGVSWSEVQFQCGLSRLKKQTWSGADVSTDLGQDILLTKFQSLIRSVLGRRRTKCYFWFSIGSSS